MRKVAIGVAGVSVVLVGIALLVLPGPGVLTILVGLGILSMEFAFAYQVIAWVKARATAAADQAEVPQRWRRIIPWAALAFSVLALVVPLFVAVVETHAGLRVVVKPGWTYRHFLATEDALREAALHGDDHARSLLERLHAGTVQSEIP